MVAKSWDFMERTKSGDGASPRPSSSSMPYNLEVTVSACKNLPIVPSGNGCYVRLKLGDASGRTPTIRGASEVVWAGSGACVTLPSYVFDSYGQPHAGQNRGLVVEIYQTQGGGGEAMVASSEVSLYIVSAAANSRAPAEWYSMRPPKVLKEMTNDESQAPLLSPTYGFPLMHLSFAWSSSPADENVNGGIGLVSGEAKGKGVGHGGGVGGGSRGVTWYSEIGAAPISLPMDVSDDVRRPRSRPQSTSSPPTSSPSSLSYASSPTADSLPPQHPSSSYHHAHHHHGVHNPGAQNMVPELIGLDEQPLPSFSAAAPRRRSPTVIYTAPQATSAEMSAQQQQLNAGANGRRTAYTSDTYYHPAFASNGSSQTQNLVSSMDRAAIQVRAGRGMSPPAPARSPPPESTASSSSFASTPDGRGGGGGSMFSDGSSIHGRASQTPPGKVQTADGNFEGGASGREGVSKSWLDNLLGVVMPLIEGGGQGGDAKNSCVDYLSRVEEDVSRCCVGCGGRSTLRMEVQEDVAGVGVTISTTDSDRLEVLGLSPGGPAERSGKVKIGDVVTAVNGVNMHSRVRDRGDASRGGVPAPGSIEGLLSGKAGTSVVLTIKRNREDGDGISTFHEVRLWRVPVRTYQKYVKENADVNDERRGAGGVPQLWVSGETPRNSSTDVYSY